jgi:hypothetical protein
MGVGDYRVAGYIGLEVPMWTRRGAASIAWAVVWASWTSAVTAAICHVPSGSYPAIQDAVDDPSCTEVVIAAGTFVEPVLADRSLIFTGDSSSTTIIEGRVKATGDGTEVELADLAVDAGAPSVAGCYPIALIARDGATVSGSNLVVINDDGDACVIFSDGFESGTTSHWSSTAP